MGKEKNKDRRVAAVLIAGLLLILIVLLLQIWSTAVFNSREKSSKDGGKQEAFLEMHPRSGSADSWMKKDVMIHGTPVDLMAATYDAILTNTGKYVVSDWTMRLDVTENCYLNNAWCGMVEIHQDVNGEEEERIQTLDMRNLDQSSIELDYVMSGQDILIRLSPGDYLIYHPSLEAGETPVKVFNGAEGKVTIGLILYFAGTKLDVSNLTLIYRCQKGVTQGFGFLLFLILSTLWVICFAACCAVVVTRRSSAKSLAKKERMIVESLDVFGNFVDAKDPYTNGHTSRVAKYALCIAKRMGLSEADCHNVYYAGLIHDVGKCYIPDEILKKPERLTDEEFETIKKHTEHGAEMLRGFSSVPDIGDGAKYHHERYDGKGYPTGKKGKEIPLIGRILCVADAFDAMNSNRCYRDRLTHEEIIQEIRKNRGTQFDPEIADLFLKILEENTDNIW